ncbi:MAG: hypothetical protein GQ558_09910 [Thermoplasmata archaeon]|nr:hypothetical protein [Thermoplasmata archaeon]
MRHNTHCNARYRERLEVVEDDVPDDGVWMGGRLAALFEGRTWEWRRDGPAAGPPHHLRPMAPPRGPAWSALTMPLSWQRGRTRERPRRSVL